MRTYYVVVTEEDYAGAGFTRDFVVFDYFPSVVDFVNGKATYNALDGSAMLHLGDEVITTFCILANGVLDAYKRAYDLRHRF